MQPRAFRSARPPCGGPLAAPDRAPREAATAQAPTRAVGQHAATGRRRRGHGTGSEAILEQITKQLNKLVDVVKLLELTEGAHVERAMMLIKVRATGAGREEIKRLSDIFRGRILDVTNSTYIIEVTGTDDKLDAFITALDRKLIIEVVRSGAIGVGRGEKALRI